MDEKWLYRKAIIETALAQVRAGSHYLMGADGGIPHPEGLSGGGLKERTIKLLNVRGADSLAIGTAQRGGYLCHGRMSRVGGFKMNIQNRKYLYDYIQQYCPEDTWENGLTPRNLDWTTVLVGESCKGKRHFDCIFFVNWVLTNALLRAKKVTFSIDQWANPKIAPVTLLDRDKISPAEIRDADIFLNLDSKPQHIGLFRAGGAPVHASGADRGVIEGDFERSRYTHILRLKDSFLKFG